jgi:hypothetical protein
VFPITDPLAKQLAWLPGRNGKNQSKTWVADRWRQAEGLTLNTNSCSFVRVCSSWRCTKPTLKVSRTWRLTYKSLLPHWESRPSAYVARTVCTMSSLSWRSWTTLKKSAHCFGGSRPRLSVPIHLRPLSTATPSSSSTASTRAALAFVALGGAILGVGGYYIGARSNSIGVNVGTARALEFPPLQKPVYGTPEDFSRAIEELRASFAGEAVTTAPDQLGAHGFSPNTHHPGMHALLSLSNRAMMQTGSQDSPIALWCTRLRPRMSSKSSTLRGSIACLSFRTPVGRASRATFTGVRTRFCVASVVLAIIAYSRCVSGRAEASAWTCLKWTRSLRFTVRSPSAEYGLSNFLPSTQRRFRPCLPTRCRVDGNQPNLERERNPAFLSRTCETLHLLLLTLQCLLRSLTLVPLRPLAAC